MNAIDYHGARRTGCERESTACERERARRLVATEVEYVYSLQFDLPDAAETLLAPLDDPEADRRRSAADAFVPEAGVPAYVAELYRVPLLTPLQEKHLFLRMNFLKHRANQLRSRLDPDHPDVSAMDRIETKLADATRIRNDIVRANLRLVVALAKDLANDLCPLEDLVAEGHLPLMRAVELFDVDRGFRFSTYATWAVRNNLHRYGPRLRKYLARHPAVSEGTTDEPTDDRTSELADLLRDASNRRTVGQLLGSLDRRDRLVVEARFGLGEADRPHRFREIAAKLGLSTERVRQLYVRALDRIRDAADIG